MQHRSTLLLATAGILLCLGGHAAAQPSYEGEPVQVTATRSAQSIDRSLAAVSVIS
ncbi:MAG: hypothetical protein GVY11_08255, partial [Gammaproteobacteria bacterium]|nr:hypothetical protein [Gammaproteobacteria bacterium]